MPSRFTREQIWRHNGYLGSTRMAYLAMNNISQAITVTPATALLAHEIAGKLATLSTLLKERDE
jgi:hypothetical protein